jgi:hypothetical protein
MMNFVKLNNHKKSHLRQIIHHHTIKPTKEMAKHGVYELFAAAILFITLLSFVYYYFVYYPTKKIMFKKKE